MCKKLSLLLAMVLIINSTAVVFAEDYNAEENTLLQEVPVDEVVSGGVIQKYLYGDADNDGAITSNDASIILQKVLNKNFEIPLQNANNYYMQYINVDEDGTLSAADATQVLQKSLKDFTKLPVEEIVQSTVFENKTNEYKFGVYVVRNNCFDYKNNANFKIIRSTAQLEEYGRAYLNYISDINITNNDFFAKYDDEFFSENFLVVGLYISPVYNAQYSVTNVEFNEGISISTKEDIVYPAMQTFLCLMKTFEFNNKNYSDNISWQIEQYDELSTDSKFIDVAILD